MTKTPHPLSDASAAIVRRRDYDTLEGRQAQANRRRQSHNVGTTRDRRTEHRAVVRITCNGDARRWLDHGTHGSHELDDDRVTAPAVCGWVDGEPRLSDG
jgi:hypothetical protein